MSLSPTWYDVLDVPRDASAEQIKAAWRAATDRFEPGSSSGQFRMFNEAADVLLDPERRREYDDSLDPAPVQPVTSPAPEVAPDDVAPAPQALMPEPEPKPVTVPRARSRPSWAFLAVLGGLNVVVLGMLALLTVAVLVTAVFAGRAVEQDAQVEDARDQAPAAAERAVQGLFSYDYRKLDDDRVRAKTFLTDSFAKTYLKNFDALKQQKDGSPGLAVQTKAVVTTNVQGSGLVNVDDDARAARVLVFVNLVSRKAEGEPQIFQNRVAMTMKKVGDRWLVDKVDSY